MTAPSHLTVGQGLVPTYHRKPLRSTLGERVLLGVAAAILPVEQVFPSFAGFSVTWILFGLMALRVLLTRRASAKRVGRHPVLLAGYVLVGTAAFIETLHGTSRYTDIIRISEALAGAGLVASLCRDKRALQATMYGYLTAGILLSAFLFSGYYRTLSSTTAASFTQASVARAATFSDNALEANANAMGFYLAEGTVVALAFAMCGRSARQRIVFSSAGVLFFVGSFLPLSRGAAVVVVVSSIVVLMTRSHRKRSILLAASLGFAVVIWAPPVVTSRLKYTTEQSFGRPIDSRVGLLNATRNSVSDYIATGAGAGRYFDFWAREHGFASRNGEVVGTHNVFVQLAVFWGSAVLGTFVVLLLYARRCLPKANGTEPLKLALRGISVALLVNMFATHNIEGKEFALGLGLVLASELWLWPRGRAEQR